MNEGDLTRKDVQQILTLSDWDMRQLIKKRLLPRIEYTPRKHRYDLADVMHLRESLKRGGWIDPKNNKAA